MIIKGIEFKVNAASGALGWAGEAYWHHRLFGLLFPSFKKTMARINFVAKTTTWRENKGNLPLNEKFEPKELFPRCIKIYFFLGMILNAVGLSGPGFAALLSSFIFHQVKRTAFGISFMPIGKTLEEMLWETRQFRNKLIEALSAASYHFSVLQSPIWVQVNQSCPNTAKDDAEILAHTKEILRPLQSLRKQHGLVLDLKINYLVSNEVIAELCKNDLIDMITISNTIKFGNQESGIPWKRLFWWRKTSPLAEFGGGALSGKPLLKAVASKIFSLRLDGIKIPIKASGGIFCAQDVRTMKINGADAIEFATVASLRPWRVDEIVEEAERIF